MLSMPRKTCILAALCTLMVLLPGLRGRAQSGDPRNVGQPPFPALCSYSKAIQYAAFDVSASTQQFTSSQTEAHIQSDTNRIQDALNNCANTGKAVELATSGGVQSAFIIKPITIPAGVTLQIDGGVTVFASNNPADFQNTDQGGTYYYCAQFPQAPFPSNPTGCLPLITVASNTSSTNGSGIIGYGVINGQGGQPFHNSDGSLATKPSGWPTTGCTTYSWWCLTLAAYSGPSNPIYQQNSPEMVHANESGYFTMSMVSLVAAPYFNVRWEGGNNSSPTVGFTAWGVKIIGPYNIPNTDGIDPIDHANSVTIADSYISNGDDNIAISANNTGYGVDDNSEFQAITIRNVSTYAGDGISIGSGTEGNIYNVLVENIAQSGEPAGTTTGPAQGQTGLKLKSNSTNGGRVSNVLYNYVCMQNQPTDIMINAYAGSGNNTSWPAFGTPTNQITFQNITVGPNSTGSTGIFELYSDPTNWANITFNNLNFSFTPTISHPQDANIILGPYPNTPASIQSISGTNINTYNRITKPAELPYGCTVAGCTTCPAWMYPQFAGQIFLSNATHVDPNTNLGSMVITQGQAITINAVLEPTTYESPTPTADVDFYYYDANNNKHILATLPATQNGTFYTFANNTLAGGGTVYEIYAEYPGDGNYSYFGWGHVEVTVN